MLKTRAVHALVALFTVIATAAHAQSRVMDIQDQPGYVPTADEENLPAQFQRQMVFFRSTEPPGTIVVDTPSRFLYLVQPGNRAIRYGIGVGRDGFQWSGLLSISRKRNGRIGLHRRK